MNAFFQSLTSFLESVLFFDILFGLGGQGKVPFVVAWLIAGGIYLTIKLNFVNLKMLRHSYQIIMGRYKTKDDVGIIEPRQALTTALSATVGLGNIAGVAIAVSIGGPGATFWMIVAGFFGYDTQIYRGYTFFKVQRIFAKRHDNRRRYGLS